MEKVLGQEFQGKNRIDFLRDNCDKVEPLGYTKQIPSEQLDKMKDGLAENSIKLKDLKDEKKEVMKDFNDQIKELEAENEKLTDHLKAKSVFVEEECFKFVDEDSRQVGYYNSDGLLVFQRPARPEELNSNVFRIARTGTDN